MKTFTTLIILCMCYTTAVTQNVQAFEDSNNWVAACESGTITTELFDNGPTFATICGTIISSNGDDCFPAGELEEGFNITASNNGGVSFYPVGNQDGNTFPIIGTAVNTASLVINMDRPNITRVAIIYRTFSEVGAIIVRDIAGNSISESFTADPSNNGVFIGYISDTFIGSIELIGEDVDLAQLYFGSCIQDCMLTVPTVNGPIDIDPGETITADCANAPNLIPITVDATGTVGVDATLLGVGLDISHTYTADLELSLISPSGTELLIVAGQGGNVEDGYNGTQFVDDGNDITQATAPYDVGNFALQGGRLDTTFFGESITGVWLLKICDNADGDTGVVNEVGLGICGQKPLSVTGIIAQPITMYPNPTNSIVNIKAATAITKVEVYNLIGQKISSHSGNTNELTIDLSSQKAGIYLANITNEIETQTIRIIKE